MLVHNPIKDWDQVYTNTPPKQHDRRPRGPLRVARVREAWKAAAWPASFKSATCPNAARSVPYSLLLTSNNPLSLRKLNPQPPPLAPLPGQQENTR